MKTQQEIEGDMYQFVKAKLSGILKGGVFRPETRPHNAKGEDAVVSFLSGIQDYQAQIGEVTVNIYVPDITIVDGRNIRNDKRIAELQAAISESIGISKTSEWVVKDGEYWLNVEITPKTIKHEEINQHCINVRLEYEYVEADNR